MATIEQRGTSWRVSWRLGGKRTGDPQSCTFKTPPGRSSDGALKLAQSAKKLAESRGHAITREEMYRAILGETPTALAGVPTLAEWAAQWLADRARFREVQPDTLTSYRQILNNRVLPQLGHLALTQIDRDKVKDWMGWLIVQDTRSYKNTPGHPLKARTIQRTHAVLHQLLGAAVEKGWIKTNPAARPAGARKGVVGLPKERRYQGMFLEPWELRAILNNCSPALRPVVYVLSRTGLRLGELLVLRGQDVVLTGDHPRIVVERSMKRDRTIGPPKTQSSVREVSLDEDTAEVLLRLADGKRRADLLFTGARGGMWHPNNLRKQYWLPAVAAAQRCAEHPPPVALKPERGPRPALKVSDLSTCGCRRVLARSPRIHDLRHTHVSILVATREWGPKEIQERVGHSSFQVTMDIYGHLWNHSDKDQLDAMRRLFAKGDEDDSDEDAA